MDFFRLLTRAAKVARPTAAQLPSAGPARPSQDAIDDDSKKADTQVDGQTKAAFSKDPDERRRLLKKHKIRISLLQDTSDQRKEFETIFVDPLLTISDLRSRFAISRRMAENLHTEAYLTSTEIQMAALPLLLDPMRTDLLAVAPTGSGKTLAFLIPLLSSLLAKKSQKSSDCPLQGIILAPTRELADQIVHQAKKLAQGTSLKITLMRKGMRFHETLQDKDDTNLVKADIIVTTPLLFLHAITFDENVLKLPSVRHLVLDEADVLLDQLFRDQTLSIWQACSNPDLQATLWSATMGSSIETLAQKTILDRRKELGSSPSNYRLVRLVVGLKDSAIPRIAQHLTYCASEKGKLMALRQIISPSPGAASSGLIALQPPFLVFTQTITRAIALSSELRYDIPAVAGGSKRIAVLHADLSDTTRADVMARFRKAEIWVLITTDLLSRGVDFRGTNGVVNYDIPNTSAAYVHRIGRTGRQGREGGIAITLYTKEDIPYVRHVANIMNAKSTQLRDQEWLLDMLPRVSKKTKQSLKQRGVEARLDNPSGLDSRQVKRMRISTKSGYDRRVENNRKDAIAASRRRKREQQTTVAHDSDIESWTGFAAED